MARVAWGGGGGAEPCSGHVLMCTTWLYVLGLHSRFLALLWCTWASCVSSIPGSVDSFLHAFLRAYAHLLVLRKLRLVLGGCPGSEGLNLRGNKNVVESYEWTRPGSNRTPLANHSRLRRVLSERDNQLHHVPLRRHDIIINRIIKETR